MQIDKNIKNNPLLYKTFLLSNEAIEIYKYLTNTKKEYIISKQFLRSTTSIGANSHEAVAAQSKRDFISKLSIAMKESSETRYWVHLLVFNDYVTESRIKKTYDLLKECMNIIGKSLITAKQNKGKTISKQSEDYAKN